MHLKVGKIYFGIAAQNSFLVRIAAIHRAPHLQLANIWGDYVYVDGPFKMDFMENNSFVTASIDMLHREATAEEEKLFLLAGIK